MKRGLVIARYQPPHVSHMEVYEYAKKNGIDELIVVKGSADKSRIPRHPFTPQECTDMVEMYLKKTGLKYQIVALDDVSQHIKQDDEPLNENDIAQYTVYAQQLIDKLPPFDVAFVGNPTIGTPLERLGKRIIKPISTLHCSSTYIRREYTLHKDRCEDLLLPEQVAYMDKHGLYDVIAEIGKVEFKKQIEEEICKSLERRL